MDSCPLKQQDEMMGLLWVGEKFYPTADHFSIEANAMGISKRIAQVPNDLVVGKTWVALAHPKAANGVLENGSIGQVPGIFRAFRPTRIEYIVTGHEKDYELERLEKRGFTLIKVEKI